MDRPMLPRSISSANLDCTKCCISYLERDLCREHYPKGTVNHLTSLPRLTLTLPSLKDYPKAFGDYVLRRLVDHRVKEELETANVINWCKNASSLIPLSTAGDGNCLLHASSLAMWGFQDRNFILRQALYSALLRDGNTVLYPRWKLWREKEMTSMDIRLDESQWKQEWTMMINTASLVAHGGALQGLEEFHIFILANVLRRPIIVYSLSKIRSAAGGTTLQRINFQGLYLPLLWDPKQCIRSPLPIAFSSGHYVALVVQNSPQEHKNGRIIIPIADNNRQEFPVMFKTREESDWDCVRAYLNITLLPNLHSGGGVACAEIHVDEPPPYMKPLLLSFIDKCFDAFQFEQSQARANNYGQVVHGGNSGRPTGTGRVQDGRTMCKSGCGYYGDSQLNGYCSKCSKKQQTTPRVKTSPQVNSNFLRCCNCQFKPGLPEYAGMCEECYHSKKTSGSGSGRGSVERRLSSGSTTAPITDNACRPCRNTGCEYTGTKDRVYYCSKCYKDKYPTGHHDTKRDRSGSDTASGGRGMTRPDVIKDELVLNGGGVMSGTGGDTRPLPSSSDSTNHKCPLCKEYYGSSEYGGLCTQCFMDRTKRLDSSSKVPPTTTTSSSQLPVLIEPYCTECGRVPGHEALKGLCDECYFKNGDFHNEILSKNLGNETNIDTQNVHSRKQQPIPSGQSREQPLPNGSDYGLQRGQSREQPLPNGSEYGLQRGQSREQPLPNGSDYGLQRVHSREQAVPNGSKLVDSPDCPNPDDPPPESTVKPLYMRTARNSTGGQTCFLCDPDQLIMISNIVCQQHALKMKKVWQNMSTESTSVHSVVRTSSNGSSVGGATPTGSGHQQYDHNDESTKPVKVLCRTAGCAFEQIPQYHGYCLDCFKGKQ